MVPTWFGMEILAVDHVVGSVMAPMQKKGWLVGGLSGISTLGGQPASYHALNFSGIE